MKLFIEKDRTVNESFTVNGPPASSPRAVSTPSSSRRSCRRRRRSSGGVTAEVLPQIRKTGGYIPTHDAEGRPLTGLEIMSLALRIQQKTIETQKEQIAERHHRRPQRLRRRQGVPPCFNAKAEYAGL